MADFKNKVIYQIYPKSFNDTNGDGIGDLPGVTEKLDYLSELGVDYLWITPFFSSPQRDNGYDVSDYRKIEPMFGTMEDVEELIVKAEEKNIGIMLDMVFNHTSTQHEWFKRALNGEKKYMDYYIFRDGPSDTPPTNWVSKFGGNAWEYVPHLKKWYLHLFDVTQADLNWENPSVREELKDIIRFWKDKGVKGFRFDVINLISKPEQFKNDTVGDGRRFYTDGHHVHQFLKEMVKDTGIEDMVTVGEMSSTSIDNCVRYSNPEEKELSMVFSFHHLKVDYKNGDKWSLMKPDMIQLKNLFQSWQEEMFKKSGWNALFWCNHDQPRIVSRLGDDKNYWKESAKMLATCIHLMRGTPYIYQGEEVGMTNAYFHDISDYRDVESLNYYKILLSQGKTKEKALEILAARSRDNSRTPMQWNREKYAGFSTVTPWLTLPVYKPEANVLEEQKDSDSIWYYYQKLIQLRKEHSVIADGNIKMLYQEAENVLAYTRENEEEKLLVLNHLTDGNLKVMLPKEDVVKEIIIGNYQEPAKAEQREISLKPYETVVFSMK